MSISHKVFCFYASEDKSHLQTLRTHLSVLESRGIISSWCDYQIVPGTNWAQTTRTHLEQASVILLLVSPDFLASDSCHEIEMHALQRHNAGEARVIPILLRPTANWQDLPLGEIQALPSNRQPITAWRNRDAAFVDVTRGIQRAIEDLTNPAQTLPSHTSPHLWHVPYSRNHFFSGREEILALLHQKLRNDTTSATIAALLQPQAIKGLGGIGKTQIAVEYAYRYRDSYSMTLWINAATKETIISDFVAIVDRLPSLPVKKNETDQMKMVEAVKRWLERRDERWLLIFDNADDIVLIREFLPREGNGSIVLTTRAQGVGSIAASSIEVEKMSLMEGSCLLLRRAYSLPDVSDEAVFEHVSVEDVNEAGNIVIALDFLPLALDQAGAYIEETQCSLSHYLVVYQASRTKLLARRGESTNYPAAVATTWSLSFQKVEQANPAAAELLCLCAFLAPDAIPEELISNGASHWSPPLQQAADLYLLDQMIAELLKFSLVKRSKETRTLSLHRLVQAVLIDAMEQDGQRQWAKRVVFAANDVFPDADDVAMWPQCFRYLSQVQVCSILVEQYGLLFVEAAHVLNRTVVYLRHHALYSIAEPPILCALTIYEKQLGREHPDTASLLNNLAGLYESQGKYEEAEPLYQRALAIYEKQLGREHPDTASLLNNLAGLYERQGNYEEAESLYQDALVICEQHVGAEHLSTATSLDNLAGFYASKDRYEEAEPLYQRVLTIYEQRLGEADHPDIATSLNNLAYLYHQQERYEEAEPLYQRALAIRERLLGREHPDTASLLNNLAGLYESQGKYAEAEPLYQRALAIYEKQLGVEHPDTASIFHNLVDLYDQQGKYGEAELLYEHVLALQEQQLGAGHPDTTRNLNNLADLYWVQGKYDQVEACYKRTLVISEQQLGTNHPDTASSLNNLADLYRVQKKDDLAEPLYRRVLGIYEQQLESGEHSDAALCLNNLALLYYQQGKHDLAEPFYQRALVIYEQQLGGIIRPEAANTLNNLARLYQEQGKYEPAKPLYERALTICQQQLDLEHPTTLRVRENYVSLLRAMGQDQEANTKEVGS